MIRRHQENHAVVLMCRVLTVSRSGYYDWRSRAPSARAQANRGLTDDIRRIHAEHKGRSGAPRITAQLRTEGQGVGRKRVARLMRAEGLRAKAARKYKATTNSNHNLPVAPNLLEQDFSATAPNQKWVSDITYIATDEGWLYLAVALDLYARRVVGWSMSERMTAKLVCDALQMALWRRKRPRGVIVHSDRGSQYCSNDYPIPYGLKKVRMRSLPGGSARTGCARLSRRLRVSNPLWTQQIQGARSSSCSRHLIRNSYQPKTVAPAGCQLDYDCGYGNRCVKPSGTFGRGQWMTPVNEYGIRTFDFPSPSVGPREVSSCRFTADCPIDFTCDKSAGGLNGLCVK